MRLLHGSYRDFPAGFRFHGGREGYEEEWSFGLPYYAALEANRPEDMIAHKDAVFACEKLSDIDRAGGASSGWCLLLEADDDLVTRHDQKWAWEITSLLAHGASEDDELVIRMANHYWSGEASDDPVWEYLAPEMRVIDSAHTRFEEDILYIISQMGRSSEFEMV